MEEKELRLIREYAPKDGELQKLWQEHLEYEKQINALDGKPFLSPADELERKRIQKLKLAGKDRIAVILAKYTKG